MNTFKFMTWAIVLVSYICGARADWTPAIWNDFVTNGTSSRLPDFSYAGYHYGEALIPVETNIAATVTDYGAVVNDGIDDTAGIGAAIAAAELTGGGVVYFPAGRYDINVNPANPTFVQLNSSNIVLRGAGSETGGTVIYLNNLLDTLNGSTLNSAAISIGHTLTSTWGSEVANITVFAPRGSDIVQIDSSDSIQVGDMYQIVSGGMGLDTIELNEYLLYPLDPASDSNWIYANGSYTHFQWLVEVVEIIDSTHIKLKQPTRADINPTWGAVILKPTMIEEIGVEDMRFESAWTGGYSHHGSDELDYFWPALNMRSVKNGWIKNVVFDDYTTSVPQLTFCKNVTVSDISVTGIAGHFGPSIARGYDCMVDGVTVDAPRTHSLSSSTRSQGNVFRNVAVNYADDQATGCYQALDFHTGYAMENLYELIDSARVQSGGDVENLPHSSRRNTFWNVKCDQMNTPYDDNNDNEFFISFYWSGSRNDDHKLYPESIVVGVYHDSRTLEIDGNSNDQDTDFIYLEGLNQSQVNPASLYQAQFDMRVPCINFASADINRDCVVSLEDFVTLANDWTQCSDPANVDCGILY